MKRSSKIASGVVVALGLCLPIPDAASHPGHMGPMMTHAMHGAAGAESGENMHMPMGGHMRMPMGGHMHMPMGGHMHNGDTAFHGDMHLVYDILHNHDKVTRTVSNLPDGIRTVTHSDDPEVAQSIKAHVASMEKRLGEGRIFNLFSSTLPVLFENRDRIKTVVETSGKGAAVTQTSSDPKVVAALQAHALEVSELARDGVAGMRHNGGPHMMGYGAQY